MVDKLACEDFITVIKSDNLNTVSGGEYALIELIRSYIADRDSIEGSLNLTDMSEELWSLLTEEERSNRREAQEKEEERLL